MSDYLVGDIQGCFDALQGLLEKLAFDPQRDRLWSVGDLVNRGPHNVETLRFLRSIDAEVVLGNHDLHLLALHFASAPGQLRRKDTLADVLDAPDRLELLQWLRGQPLCRWLPERKLFLSHAGLPHIWTLEQALGLAAEVESVLQSEHCATYFDAMYGNEPAGWSEDLAGATRWRVITNYFTRMRFVDAAGALELTTKETVDKAPKGYRPWFDYARSDRLRIAFGHWAALAGHTGHRRMMALDTGCVWGGALTALNLETGQRTACVC
jgi:bis(5'-nucleosyl)-tetraphosphatase (symmetrical)